jgi:hypothetical protein
VLLLTARKIRPVGTRKMPMDTDNDALVTKRVGAFLFAEMC